MISDKQLEANRRNAQHSTGPKTTEGKAQSSRNNLRHGLTGQISLLPTEDRAAHDAFCSELTDSFQPEAAMERQLAQSIAEDSWRLNRACAIENNMFALGHSGERREVQIALADAKFFQQNASQFNLLTIYEQRINRNLQRNLKLLRELQAERIEQRRQKFEEAQLLAQLSLSQGLAYDPAEFRTGASPLCGSNAQFRTGSSPLCGSNNDGFVFSSAEINRAIDRDNRLKAAREAASAHRPAVATAA